MDPRSLNVTDLVEDPDRLEALIIQQQDQSVADANVRALLDSIYLERDRAKSFDRFRHGLEFKTILKLLDLLAVPQTARLCEIGGGPGFLSWALADSGYSDVHLLEPNGHFNTGTGYLRSRPDARVHVHNDLSAWHASQEPYDVVVTKNCIHHFKNIAQAAAGIRQKMHPHGRWYAFREWFADTPQELYAQIAGHPYCQPYGLYEWPYPASHYVEAIEIAGFKLQAVVPATYANNALALFQEDEGGEEVRALTRQVDDALMTNPEATVSAFWDEIIRNRFQKGTGRFFSRPQLMVFAVTPV